MTKAELLKIDIAINDMMQRVADEEATKEEEEFLRNLLKDLNELFVEGTFF